MKWKEPPKAKVYEALSAVLDGRVRLAGPGEAEVLSSSRDKTYNVRWTDRSITSNDNASRFQGYTGYPIIAVLLATGLIPFDREVAAPLAGVHWKELNDRFKRDYDKAVDHALDESGVDDGARHRLREMVNRIYGELLALELERPAARPSRA